MPAIPFIIQGATTIGTSLIGAHAAHAAANEQQQAGQQAAQSFGGYQTGGLEAFNTALGMYGLAPVTQSGPLGTATQNLTQALQTTRPQGGSLLASILARQQAESQPVVPLPVTRPTADEGPMLGDYGVKGGSSYAS